MARADEISFVVHGLEVDNGIVRASVFAKKLRTLVSALELADRIANEGAGHRYMLADLSKGSASVRLREKVRNQKKSRRSGISLFEETTEAIYTRRLRPASFPRPLVDKVSSLSFGAAKQFSHAELAFPDNKVIRIDDYLARQAEAITSAGTVMPEGWASFFDGIAIGSFDGVLKEIDARGTMLRGKLILSAGGIEVDCVMNKDRVPEARDCFDKRVIVEGYAHYDGSEPLPVRIDVNMIRIVGDDANLSRWRGAFNSIAEAVDDQEEW